MERITTRQFIHKLKKKLYKKYDVDKKDVVYPMSPTDVYNLFVEMNMERIRTGRSITPTKIRKKLHQQFNSKKTDLTFPVSADDMYDLFMEVLTDEIFEGNVIALRGFGVFELRLHRGHKTYFNDSKDHIDDYVMLKFAASNVINQRLRDDCQILLEKIQNNTTDSMDKDET